jgi:hypothetical protein
MKRSLITAATVFAALALSASAALAVPGQMNFTGRLADGSGPVTGSVNIDFKIFDAATAGTMLWEESKSGVTADAGLVYVTLGTDTGNALDATVFTGGAAWLEVTVNGDTMSPRLALLAVPYAVHAATADTLGTLAPGDVALSNHNHNGVYAPVSHNHSAADITSGTLNNARFSAYSDLGDEGRLDNNNAADLLTQGQGDGRYAAIGHTHPSSGTLSCRRVTATASGTGTYIHAYANCDSDEQMTGGGCETSNLSPTIYRSQPAGPGTWICSSNEPNVQRTVTSNAMCCKMQ